MKHLLLTSRRRRRDATFQGRPTLANPLIMDGPGTGCALVMCDHVAILCTPEEYAVTQRYYTLRKVNSVYKAHRQLNDEKIHTDVGELAILKY